MVRFSFVTRPLGSAGRRSWRRIGVALLMGLALTLAACGARTGGGEPPTPTPKPTPSPSPLPVTWRVVPSPNVEHPIPGINALQAVTALSPSTAWAVGYTFAGALGPTRSVVERWDGSSWRLVTNPGPGSLFGVAAVSANDVWAVGHQGGEYDNQTNRYVYTTLTMHWNGTQWNVVPSPNPDLSSFLKSVAAVTANDIWAVGYSGPLAGPFGAGSGAEALIEHWDGTSWQVVTSPIPSAATASTYMSVTRIPGTNQLWAVGYARYGPTTGADVSYFQLLIERRDGSAWHFVPSPILPSGAFSGELNGVVALSATNAWAVGDYTGSDHKIRTLIIHWDSASWKIVTGPDQWGSLASVAAVGANDVRAVGHLFTGDGNSHHLLIEQWNGATWQIAPSPEPSGQLWSGLYGVTTDDAGNYWAVGYHTPNTPNTASTQTPIVHCP